MFTNRGASDQMRSGARDQNAVIFCTKKIDRFTSRCICSECDPVHMIKMRSGAHDQNAVRTRSGGKQKVVVPDAFDGCVPKAQYHVDNLLLRCAHHLLRTLRVVPDLDEQEREVALQGLARTGKELVLHTLDVDEHHVDRCEVHAVECDARHAGLVR